MQYVWTLKAGKTPQQVKADFEKDKSLAAQGDAEAMYRLSGAYAGGHGTERNRDESLRWLRQSAESGSAAAQEALGYMLVVGDNVAKDPDEGWAWTEKAAAQGRAQAQMALGMSLLSGRDREQDPVRGRALLEKSIAQGNTMAMGLLGTWLLREGGEPQRGLELLETAADKQDRLAQFTLGEALEKGELLPQDNARAFALYQRSAAGGYAPAAWALVRLQPPAAKP
jgi:TPR repeat protein